MRNRPVAVAAAAAAACVAATLLVIAARGQPAVAVRAYFFGFSVTATLVVGALFVLMVGNSTRASWFVPLRRQCEHVVAAMPVLIALFVPLAFSMDQIYPWLHPDRLPAFEQERVMRKLAWLEPRFFLARSLVYLATMTIVAELLRRWSFAQDRSPSRATLLRTRMVATSSVGLVGIGVVASFMGWDWFMSIEPAWHSNLYGAYLIAEGFCAALSLVTGMVVLARRRNLLPAEVGGSHFHALGRLQLTAVAFWAYLGFCHLLLQWIAELPDELVFHLKRWTHGWQWLGLALVFCQFVLPFSALLSRGLKSRPMLLLSVSIWLLWAHVLSMFYLIVPAARATLAVSWLDLAGLVAPLAACGAVALARAKTAHPSGDPEMAAGVRYESIR